MSFDLAAVLPVVLPAAIAWAERRASELAAAGVPLSPSGIDLARRVGVIEPERIRIGVVDALPVPDDPLLRQAALATGLLGPHMAGLTLGHGIYLCRGRSSPRLLAHECRHVHQYEQAGSIAMFLPTYLEQIATVGYESAPLEQDARAYECYAD